ncbi:Tup N-terminal-domain-containing protein, partial [Chytriomyces sp. MP71]
MHPHASVGQPPHHAQTGIPPPPQPNPPPPSSRGPPLPGAGHAGQYARLPELAESLRIEVEHAVNDLAHIKQQRDDFEAKLNAQAHELMNFQQQFFELERAQKQQKTSYEDEIQRLHKELDMARGGSGNIPPIQPQIDRHGYKSAGIPQYPDNLPPPQLASGENGSGVFGALMGGGGNTGGPQDPNHPAKRMRQDEHPQQQQIPTHQQQQQQQGYMSQQKVGPPPMRQEHAYPPQQHGQGSMHSPNAVGPDMKRKMPPTQPVPPQYAQAPPPQHMQPQAPQQQQQPVKQQYPPQPQQHAYQQGPPPQHQQGPPPSHYPPQ